jgi:hypothetical protein
MSERRMLSERELEERAKRAFDASADAIDAATRSRLTQARFPAGAAAAALVVTLALWQTTTVTTPELAVAAVDDLEILLGEEDLEMLEELEFYAWLEEQPEFDAATPEAGATDDGVG